MNPVLWVVAAMLAAVFLSAGAMKVGRAPEQLTTSGLGWAKDFSPSTVKVIGVLEILCALGLLLPPITGIAAALAPVAAVGLAAVMVGAAITHARRGEFQTIAANALVLVFAAVIAWGRFGPYDFTS